MMSNSIPIEDAAYEKFVAEIQEVQGTLLAATTELLNPLGDLVRAQIRRSQPPLCGATVLTVSATQEALADDGDIRRRRILLAAALEMLHIALNVHRLLVAAAIHEQNAGGDESLDRSFIGSTILAGDYCFSRAAQLAAQTDHPRVVATFSLALQTVSEELLREQFHSGSEEHRYDETRQLLESGAHAAALLVGLSASEQQEAIALSHQLASHWLLHQRGTDTVEWRPLTKGGAPLPAAWQLLYHWLSRQQANGEVPAAAQTHYR